MRKSQITIYIIIGLLAVFIFLSVYLTDVKKTEAVAPITIFEFDGLHTYLEECLSESVYYATIWSGENGGQFNPEMPFVPHGIFKIPLYETKVPNKSKIEEGIAEFITIDSTRCLKNAKEDFSRLEFGRETEPITEVKIDMERARAKINWPIIVEQNGVEKRIEPFEVTVPTPLLRAHMMALSIIEDHKTIEGQCVSCLTKRAEQFKMQVRTVDNDGTLLFGIYNPTEPKFEYAFGIPKEVYG